MSPQLPSKKQPQPVRTLPQQRREEAATKRLARTHGHDGMTKAQLAKLLYRTPDDITSRLLFEAISAGDTNERACQIAGIDVSLIDEWLKRATTTGEPLYTAFRRGYTQAIAQRNKQHRELVPLVQGFDVALLCTPERLEEIFHYMERGVFPTMAIEATGIPASVFFDIVSAGQQNPDSPYRHIYLNFITMQAKARVNAEMRVYEESPLAWLMNGPGRDRPGSPGWTRQSAITGQDGGAVAIVTTQWGNAPAPLPPPRADVIEAIIQHADEED